MFNSKSRSSVEKPTYSATIIGSGITITGNIESTGDIRIDGILKGNLSCKSKILIGAEGVIEGDITGDQADILGTVHGNIKMNDLLHLHGKANVEGDIHAGKLQIETTVNFNGQCQMGANIVELNTVLAAAVNE